MDDETILSNLSFNKQVIRAFCERMERLAEDNMLKTHKLEGMHYAAMKKLRDELTSKDGVK